MLKELGRARNPAELERKISELCGALGEPRSIVVVEHDGIYTCFLEMATPLQNALAIVKFGGILIGNTVTFRIAKTEPSDRP